MDLRWNDIGRMTNLFQKKNNEILKFEVYDNYRCQRHQTFIANENIVQQHPTPAESN